MSTYSFKVKIPGKPVPKGLPVSEQALKNKRKTRNRINELTEKGFKEVWEE